MNWEALVVAALALWGWAFPPNIVVLEETVRYSENALARTTHDNYACYIHVYPSTWSPDYDPFVIVAHEVGHCIALPHIEQAGIMNAIYTPSTEFSGYDRAEFWHHYPAPYRVTIGMVAQ